MDWKFSEEQTAYAEALQDWLESMVDSEKLRGWFDQGDHSEFVAAFQEDWGGAGISEEEGGQGGGLVELALTAEHLARVDAPSADWMATVLAAAALVDDTELAETALTEGTTALLAPVDQIPSTFVGVQQREDGLYGFIPTVLAGDTATQFIAVVEGFHGTELHLVSPEADKITRTPRRLLDKSRTVADIRLEGVASVRLNVDAAQVLQIIDQRAAVLTAADALGASQKMLDLSVEYSKQRKQFGVYIGSFQAVKHAAATIMVGVEAARSAVYYTAASVDSSQPDADLHAAAVKAQVTAEASRAADSALTIHGAIGYTWEHDLQLFYKRARLDETLFGSPDAWNDRLADALELTDAHEQQLPSARVDNTVVV